MDEVEKLIQQLLDSDPGDRWNVVVALGEIGEPAVPALIEALYHSSLQEGYEITIALGKIGEPAVPALIEALDDVNTVLQELVATTLGHIGDVRAVEPLIGMFRVEDSITLTRVLRALVDIGEPAVPRLLDALKSSDKKTRWRAAGVLGEIRDARAIPALIDALKNHPDDFAMRDKAIGALEEIGDACAIPALIGVLKDKNPDVRGRAAWALGKIAAKADIGLAEIQRLLQDDMKGVEPKDRESAKRLVAEGYANIANIVIEKKKAQMDGVLSEGTVPKPRGDKKTYRTRRAVNG